MIKKIASKIVKQQQLSKQISSNIHSSLNTTLQEEDPEIYNLVQQDIERQKSSVNLLLNENIPSKAVMECVGSVMNAKYSEGYPGQRYYGGTEQVDKVEVLAQKRALEAFGVADGSWDCNVQSLSSTMANMAVLTALLPPHGRVMSLKGSHGGSHGIGMANDRSRPINSLEKYFEVVPYFQNNENYIDYDRIRVWAEDYKPKVITLDATTYNRQIEWEQLKQICNKVGAYLVADITSYSSVYAKQLLESPFKYCDVIISGMHGHLRGNRGALIFYNIEEKQNQIEKLSGLKLKEKIDQALFPGLQGGPHNHSITGIACALGEVNQDYFKDYTQQCLNNTQAFTKQLLKDGFQIVSNGTDNTQVLINVRNQVINGYELENVADRARLYLSSHTVQLDKDISQPSGVQICSNYMTSRGCMEKDFIEIAKLFGESVSITQNIVQKYGYDFKRQQFSEWIKKEWQNYPEINTLRTNVKDFASQFPIQHF